jgi:hypothetical protein
MKGHVPIKVKHVKEKGKSLNRYGATEVAGVRAYARPKQNKCRKKNE